MSDVVKGQRGPVHLRVAIQLTLGCVLLGGCSTGSDRFSSASFSSGYEGTPPAKTSAAAPARPAPDSRQSALPASAPAPANTGSGYQLASANPSQQAGYLNVSRVDLPPLPERRAPQGTKTADGYGRYNQPPIPDGTYSGPRATSPYDEQRPDFPAAGVYVPADRSRDGERGYGPSAG